MTKKKERQGPSVRVKTMKHLLQALFKWREEYKKINMDARSLVRSAELNDALALELELVPSAQNHDYLLRFVETPRSSSDIKFELSLENKMDSAPRESIEQHDALALELELYLRATFFEIDNQFEPPPQNLCSRRHSFPPSPMMLDSTLLAQPHFFHDVPRCHARHCWF